jgi:PAS domain S-box-containing protein
LRKENSCNQQPAESDSWRRIVLENALDAVVGMDDHQSIIDWNCQAETTFGWKRSEVIGKKLVDVLIPPEYRAAHSRGLHRFLETGEGALLNRRVEVEALHRDGSIFPVELTVIPIRLEDRFIFYSFLRDISHQKILQRKQTEISESLRQSERQLRIITNSLPAFISYVDRDLRYRFVNDHYLNWFKLNRSQIVGKSIPELLGRTAFSERKSYFERVLAGETITFETTLKSPHPDSPSSFEVTLVPDYDVAHTIQGVFIVGHDVTDRKNAESRTRNNLIFLSNASNILSSSLNYNETLQTLADLTVPQIADWCLIHVLQDNEPTTVAWSYSDSDAAKKLVSFFNIYPLERSMQMGPTYVMTTGNSELFTDFPLKAVADSLPDSEFRELFLNFGFISSLSVPIQARGKTLGSLTLMSTAASHRHYTQSDLELAQELGRRAGLAVDNARLYEEAQNAVKARDEFLSIASHELKTPLTTLNLQNEVAFRRLAKNDADFSNKQNLEKFFQNSQQQLTRLQTLVDDMLDISRIAHGKLRLELEDHVDLGAIVQTVMEHFSENFVTRGCTFRLALDSGVKGKWDRFRIEQVVNNLISNAIKYGEGKPIDISVTKDGNYGLLKVHDRGMGIDKTKLETIFLRFERAISSNNISGLGLGLYISRQIVESHNGKIWADSDPKRGSTFSVLLPLQTSPIL